MMAVMVNAVNILLLLYWFNDKCIAFKSYNNGLGIFEDWAVTPRLPCSPSKMNPPIFIWFNVIFHDDDVTFHIFLFIHVVNSCVSSIKTKKKRSDDNQKKQIRYDEGREDGCWGC